MFLRCSADPSTMDDDSTIGYNRERWETLAQNRVIFSRPWLDLDKETSRNALDPMGLLPDAIAGKKVLCLASGGGQQSAAFALLGAEIAVLDFSETQLERDRETALAYGLEIRTLQGDMRDLSAFAENSFDIVWQPPSINYVGDAPAVIGEVSRVLKPGGFYFLEFSNPMTMGIEERSWNGTSYPLKRFYIDGEKVDQDFDEWEIWDEAGNRQVVAGPRQYRHILSTLLNTLAGCGFVTRKFWELVGNPSATPGSWEHFTAMAPSTLGIWSELCPPLIHGK